MEKIKYGVSPAFFLSKFGENFTPDDVCDSLSIIRGLGFDCFQAEIVHRTDIGLWLPDGATKVRKAASQNQLYISQFVAHFMMEAFADHQTILSPAGISEMEQVFDIVVLLGNDIPVTVAFGPFDGQIDKTVVSNAVDKMSKIAAMANRKGIRLMVEIQPGAIVQGAEEILQFITAIGYGTGYNLDTGHAWASGHKVENYPGIIGNLILGSHLCDNDGKTNLSLCPGEGSINFPSLIKELLRSGYRGSLDLEIFGSVDLIEEKYAKGLDYIKRLATKPECILKPSI